MNFSKLCLLALPLLVACSAQTEAQPASAAQEVSSSWFATNLPAGSAAEAKVLALVNDPNMSMASFVARCGFSESQAAAIVSYRTGDEPASSADDQRFETLAELDALPFTDAGFWSAAKACASNAAPVPPSCAQPPVVIELVVDESGSMDIDGKWVATRDALIALIERLNTTAGPNVHLGALRFGTTITKKVAPRPITRPEQAEALVNALATPDAGGGGTATALGLTEAYDIVGHATTSPGSRGVVVLLSDGIPNGGATEQANVLQLVGGHLAGGITTYSVGIGQLGGGPSSSYDPAFMGKIALEGGTAPAGCDPLSTIKADTCHHQITPGSGAFEMKRDLLDAFLAISASATAGRSCP